jgi:hypothetical protein
MIPMMSASEREVPVLGRSYSPAFLGWCSAMRSSLTWNSRSSSYHPGHTRLRCLHPEFWRAMLKGNSHAKHCCFASETSQESVREGEKGVGQSTWEAPGHDRRQRHTSE